MFSMDWEIFESYGVPIDLLIERELNIDSSGFILAYNPDVLRKIEDDVEILEGRGISDVSSLENCFIGCAYL